MRLRPSTSLRLLITCAVVMLLAAAAQASCPETSSKEPAVETIAGNGAPGFARTDVTGAAFLLPAGIAVGPSGSIYVADTAAQNIRRIHSGTVETVAGISSPGVTPEERVGGYIDGPISVARFSHPQALAVARDGTIYVADTWNHAVRKIDHSLVSTLAGGSAGSKDGEGRNAQFSQPTDIAIDSEGNLYVADSQIGIRRVTPDGSVTTLDLPHDGSICGVAVRGGGNDLQIAYTDADGVHLREAARDQYLPFTTEREPNGEGYPVGRACRIAILAYNTLAVSDTFANEVRFLRFGIGMPVGSEPMVYTLAGGLSEGTTTVGGFRDGAAALSLTNVPQGLAVQGSTIIFADSGNRRIRRITNVNARGPVGASMENFAAPPGDYRIALFGTSFAYYDVLWQQSIEGQIESGLTRDRARVGLEKCPYVTAIRYSGTDFSQGIDFISTYLADGEANLVIFLIAPATLDDELKHHPATASNHEWKKIIPRQLAQLNERLNKSGTKLLLLVVPYPDSISPTEKWGARDDMESAYVLERTFEAVIASSGVPTLKMLEPMMQAEESPVHPSFFFTDDAHPTPQGSTFIGQTALKYLETWRPWRQ